MKLAEDIINDIPKGLLGWYDFKKSKNMLYVGNPNEDILPLFESADISINYVSSNDLVENRLNKLCDLKFDYAIINETLERYVCPKEILISVKKLLRDDGILLLGMNNRFGIRYFCGDRDPYTGRSFDSVENYRRSYANKDDCFNGRMYNMDEIRRMLDDVGWKKYQFFSVFSDLKNPSLIYAHDYLPNEDLSNRVFPVYNYPKTVFLEEENIYSGLIANGMFHQMANAYLVECTDIGELTDIQHITASLDRGRENAMFTIIRRSGVVEKKAVYPEGKHRIECIVQNLRDLKSHGIKVVDAKIENGVCKMPFVDAQVGQVYLKQLILTDKYKFLNEFDNFKNLILNSSEIISNDSSNGNGVILKKAYLDMVPLNSFYINGEFVFYDQEFCEDNYPANVLLFRMIGSFYHGNEEFQKIISMNELFERYGLMNNIFEWRRMEARFLDVLCNRKELLTYHEKHRRDSETVNINRQRMNYSDEDYMRMFSDIFRDIGQRKIILFGSGNFTKKFIALYYNDYPVYAIIDNDKEKWGKELEKIKIYPPDFLCNINNSEYKVIICIKNYLSVMKQLDEMGIKNYSIYDAGKSYPRKNKLIINQEQCIEDEVYVPKKYHIGYIAGVFDLFHIGHLNMFKRAKEQCDYLIVGVLPDEGVLGYKKKLPFIPFDERIEMIRSCRYVDEAVEIPVNYGGTRDAYKMYHFDCQFSGSDYKDNPNWLSNREFLRQNGSDLVFFPYTEQTSSTKIKALIEKGLI